MFRVRGFGFRACVEALRGQHDVTNCPNFLGRKREILQSECGREGKDLRQMAGEHREPGSKDLGRIASGLYACTYALKSFDERR